MVICPNPLHERETRGWGGGWRLASVSLGSYRMIEWVHLVPAVSPIRCRPIPIGKACFLRHSNFLAVARPSKLSRKELIVVDVNPNPAPPHTPFLTVSSQWHPSQPPLAPSRAPQHHGAPSDACPRPPSARPTAPTRAPSAARSPPPRSPTSATTPPRMAPTRTSCTSTLWSAPWARSPLLEPSPRSKVSRDEQLPGAENVGWWWQKWSIGKMDRYGHEKPGWG